MPVKSLSLTSKGNPDGMLFHIASILPCRSRKTIF